MSFRIHLVGTSGGYPACGAERILSGVGEILVSAGLLREGLRIPQGAAPLRSYRRFSEALEFLEEASRQARPVALLVSGDPLLFGAGRTLIERFGPEVVEIHPAPSYAQLAFSRLKIPWERFFFVSLHGGPRDFTLEELPGLLRLHGRLCVFTDRKRGPREIALQLAGRVPEEDLRFVVAQRLGHPDEALWEGRLSEALSRTFSEPNLVLLLYDGPGRGSGFGLSTDEIAHSRGLITKDEIRAVVLHRLDLPERGVLWDVGAGAGGVSTEAARLRPLLRVFAVERSRSQLALLEENRRRFGLLNLEAVAGEAPEALEPLPDPDRVFVGGSGGRLSEILAHLAGRPFRGPLVLTLVSLENLDEARSELSRLGFKTEVSQVIVLREARLARHTRLSPETSVFVLRAVRG